MRQIIFHEAFEIAKGLVWVWAKKAKVGLLFGDRKQLTLQRKY